MWIEPEDGFAIVEFEAFARLVVHAGSLKTAILELIRYDWLPIEGRDFIVRYDRAIANGVAIESEVPA